MPTTNTLTFNYLELNPISLQNIPGPLSPPGRAPIGSLSVELGAESTGGDNTSTEGLYLLDEAAIGRDHPQGAGIRMGADQLLDLVIGGIAPSSVRNHDLDGARRRKLPGIFVKDTCDGAAGPFGELIQVGGKIPHRPVRIVPPSVGTRPDHVHRIHDPSLRHPAYLPISPSVPR